MYPDSGYKTTHAQSVCTRPFSRGEGPGDEASTVFDHSHTHIIIYAHAHACGYHSRVATTQGS